MKQFLDVFVESLGFSTTWFRNHLLISSIPRPIICDPGACSISLFSIRTNEELQLSSASRVQDFHFQTCCALGFDHCPLGSQLQVPSCIIQAYLTRLPLCGPQPALQQPSQGQWELGVASPTTQITPCPTWRVSLFQTGLSKQSWLGP